MDDFQSLLNEFEDLPKEKAPSPTFLEISGYPHYEKVISNILTFYLDNRNPHHFGIIPVKSLLSATGVDMKNIDSEELMVNDAVTEETTEDGKFIDIVIETGSYVIGIENKIYADEYNPFIEYKTHIEKRANSIGKKPILILLTLKKNNYKSEITDSFKRINYDNLFTEFDKWALNENKADSEYLIFYNNFKQTLLNMGASKFSDEELEFLSKKYDSLVDLHQRVFVKFEKFSIKQLNIIDELLTVCKKAYGVNLSTLSAKKGQLEAVSFYEFENLHGTKAEHLNLKVKLRIRPRGWYIEIWDHGTRKESNLKQFLVDVDIKNRQKNDLYEDKGVTDPQKYSYICEKFEFKESHKTIADKLQNYFKKISNYINS